MASELSAISIAAEDPRRLSQFWASLLGVQVDDQAREDESILLRPSDGSRFGLRFVASHEPKERPLQMHLDLTSESLEHQQQTVVRTLELGGRHHDVGQLPEERHVVLADPEGNEFCVIPPGSDFLADTGTIGAVASDGTRAVGLFWSAALDWPLVWDQEEETAIQSPAGGSKISWGGPPVAPKVGPNRWRLELAPAAGADAASEMARLESLGASRLDRADGTAYADVVMLDPDGNEFVLRI